MFMQRTLPKIPTNIRCSRNWVIKAKHDFILRSTFNSKSSYMPARNLNKFELKM